MAAMIVSLGRGEAADVGSSARVSTRSVGSPVSRSASSVAS